MLNGFHAAVGPITFGPYDTVFAAGGLLFVIGGIASIVPLSKAAKRTPASENPEAPTTEVTVGR